MFQAMHDAKADFNQVVYRSRPVSWKNQTLTPNPDTIYLMPFYNTKDAGPMVLEIPPAGEEESITGSVDEAWQTAIEDVGPAGVDKGKGGKYLDPAARLQVVGAGRLHRHAIRDLYWLTRCCARILRAPAKPRSPKPWPTASASSSTRFRKRPILGRQSSSMRSTSCSTARFHTTRASFKTLDRVVQREPWIRKR